MSVERVFVEGLVGFLKRRYEERLVYREFLSVSELVACRRKAFLYRSVPFSSLLTSLKACVLKGIFAHMGVEVFLEEARECGFLKWDGLMLEPAIVLELEHPVLEELGLKGVVGRPDAVACCGEEEAVVLEFKFSKRGGVREHWRRQVEAYVLLAEEKSRELGLSADVRGALVVFSDEGLEVVEVDKPGVGAGEFFEELLSTWTSPRYSWECSYCIFRESCPRARRGGPGE